MSKKNNSKTVQSITSSWWKYVALLYSAFILVVFPLLTDSTGFGAITIFKFRTFMWSSVIFFGAVVLPFLYVWIVGNQRNRAIRKSILPRRYSITQLFVLFYVLWAIVSAINSPYLLNETFMGQGRQDGLVSYLLYGFVFILVSFWSESNDYFLRGITITGAIFGFISITQMFVKGIINTPGYWFWTQPFMGTIGNVDMVAGFAALYIPAILTSYVFEKDKRWNPLYLVSIVLFMFSQTVGDADSGKVGIAFGLFLTFPFLLDTKEHARKCLEGLTALLLGIFFAKFFGLKDGAFHFQVGKKVIALFVLASLSLAGSFGVGFIKKEVNQKKMQKYIAIALLVILLIAVIFLFFYNGDNRLLNEISDILHLRMDDNAGSGRGYLWKTSFMIAKRRPVFGLGPGTFFAAYLRYDRFSTKTDFAHNDFLQNAVTIGFVGVAFQILFILSLAYRAIRNANGSHFIIVFASGCAAYLAHSFFSFSLAIVTPMFWVMAGMLEKEILRMEAQRKEEKQKAKEIEA